MQTDLPFSADTIARADSVSTDLILAALPYGAAAILGAAIALILHHVATRPERSASASRAYRLRQYRKRANARARLPRQTYYRH